MEKRYRKKSVNVMPFVILLIVLGFAGMIVAGILFSNTERYFGLIAGAISIVLLLIGRMLLKRQDD